MIASMPTKTPAARRQALAEAAEVRNAQAVRVAEERADYARRWEAAKCPACDGRRGAGEIVRRNGIGDLIRNTWKACPTCRGAGVREEFVTRHPTHVVIHI